MAANDGEATFDALLLNLPVAAAEGRPVFELHPLR
jgi:hypothetical protein